VHPLDFPSIRMASAERRSSRVATPAWQTTRCSEFCARGPRSLENWGEGFRERNRAGSRGYWWALQDSNLGPSGYHRRTVRRCLQIATLAGRGGRRSRFSRPLPSAARPPLRAGEHSRRGFAVGCWEALAEGRGHSRRHVVKRASQRKLCRLRRPTCQRIPRFRVDALGVVAGDSVATGGEGRPSSVATECPAPSSISVRLRSSVSYGIECTETGQPDNELQGSRWLGHEVQRENGPLTLGGRSPGDCSIRDAVRRRVS
jgi:hypothetical protein